MERLLPRGVLCVENGSLLNTYPKRSCITDEKPEIGKRVGCSLCLFSFFFFALRLSSLSMDFSE